MSETMKIEQKEEEQKAYTAEEFAKSYSELCEKMGYRIVVNPAYIARDDGSFSTILQYSVGALSKKNSSQQL